MVNAKHTPGPWKAQGPYDGYIQIDAPDGEVIAQVGPYISWAEANRYRENAALIASAPALLKALVHVTNRLEKATRTYATAVDMGAIDEALGAIAQATAEGTV